MSAMHTRLAVTCPEGEPECSSSVLKVCAPGSPQHRIWRRKVVLLGHGGRAASCRIKRVEPWQRKLLDLLLKIDRKFGCLSWEHWPDDPIMKSTISCRHEPDLVVGLMTRRHAVSRQAQRRSCSGNLVAAGGRVQSTRRGAKREESHPEEPPKRCRHRTPVSARKKSLH